MKTRHFAWIAAAAVLVACDSPLDTNPTASIDSETAITTARGVELALNGAYNSLQPGDLYGVNAMVYPDMYADNLDFTGTFQTDRQVAQRNISTSNVSVLGMWEEMYEGINRTNNILAAIPNISDLSASEAAQYRGEALFIRSLHYSLALSYWGDVPHITEPSRSLGEESLVSRDPAADVYASIITDLEEAATLLSADVPDGRATPAAANALLARVYLETGDYDSAVEKATDVIDDGYTLPDNFATVFRSKNSSESIFELQYSLNNSNSQAFWFFPQSLGGRWGYAPSADLEAAFEPGDERLDVTIGIDEDGDPYGNKYTHVDGTDNVIVLRLAEMYLIRAEANARLGVDPAIVRADIDEVRVRADLLPLPATVDTEAELLAAVLQERRVELAFEGHRFFDLRRHEVAAAVLEIPATRLLWPIPQAERDVNINLGQNLGY